MAVEGYDDRAAQRPKSPNVVVERKTRVRRATGPQAGKPTIRVTAIGSGEVGELRATRTERHVRGV